MARGPQSSLLAGLARVGDFGVFGLCALREAFRPPFEIREVLRQVYDLGSKSAPLVAVSGLAIGVVLSMHTRASLERFGAETMMPAVLALSLFKETGPLTTGLLISGRVGAGIGAELGSMRVTEQIDALESLGVDTFKYLVSTRVMVCMVILPLLTTILNFTGILGGYLAEGVSGGMSFSLFLHRIFENADFIDYIPSTIKTVVFGFIIGVVSCYLGYNVSGGAEGVGRAATRSVVLSSVILIAANVVMVKGIFFLFPGRQ